MEKIQFRTLKECLQFLEWLRGWKLKAVAAAFVEKLKSYYQLKPKFKGQLQFQYANFLKNVSSLRTKVLSNKVTTLVAYAVKTENVNYVLDALLDCIPKFLAALHFLQYRVDITFRKVGGGDWASKYTNFGDFHTFLTTGNDILAGGFSAVELNNIQGGDLVQILREILNKDGARGTTVHYHFRNVIMTTLERSWNTFNTGNTVILVYTFCQFVTENVEPDGGMFKKALDNDLGGHKICWEDLKNHCKLLHGHINTLTDAGFSFTGMWINPSRKEDCAKAAAKWFREILPKAAGVLKGMIPYSVDENTLRSFAKDQLYPHGFIFDGSEPSVWAKASKLDDWGPILQMFRQLDGLLQKLKIILDGYNCGAVPLVTEAEDAKRSSSSKVEGAQNQQDQDKGSSSGSRVETFASVTAPGEKGETEPKGPVAPGHSQSQNSSHQRIVTTFTRDSSKDVPEQSLSTHIRSVTGSPDNLFDGNAIRKVSAYSVIRSDSAPGAVASMHTRESGSRSSSYGPSGSSSDENRQARITDAQSATAGKPIGTGVDSPGNVTHSQEPIVSVQAEPSESASLQPQKLAERRLSLGSPSSTAAAYAPPSTSSNGHKDSSSVVNSNYEVGSSQRNVYYRSPTAAPSVLSTAAYHHGGAAGTDSRTSTADTSRGNYQRSSDINGVDISNGSTDHFTGDTGLGWGGGEGSARIMAGNPHSPYTTTPVTAIKTKDIGVGTGHSIEGEAVDVHFPKTFKFGFYEPADVIGFSNADLTPSSKKHRQASGPIEITPPFQHMLGVEGEKIPNPKLKDPWRHPTPMKKHTSTPPHTVQKYPPITSKPEDIDITTKLLGITAADVSKPPRNDILSEPLKISPAAPPSLISAWAVPNRNRDPAVLTLPPIQMPGISTFPANVHPVTEKLDDQYVASMPEIECGPIKDAPNNITVDQVPGDVNFEMLLLSQPVGHTIADPNVRPSRQTALPLHFEGGPPQPIFELEIEKPYHTGITYNNERQMPSPPINLIEPASPDNTYGGSPSATSDDDGNSNDPNNWGKFQDYAFNIFPNLEMCNNPWNYVHDSSTSPTLTPIPDTEHLPLATTVKAMLFWLVGFNTHGLIAKIEKFIEGLLKEINSDASHSKNALQITRYPDQLPASHVADSITEACLYAAQVLNGIMRMKSKDALSPIDFKSEYSKLRYATDPAGLLCQLRDYVYACHHQLAFLKSQCNRDKLSGGWQSHEYGSDLKTGSPLQAFLTDSWDSTFNTHLFDPCNLCLKSRVRMGFRDKDLPSSQQTGSILASILSPSCGGSDPLLTLASYLNCLTRRTPRTTGELVSFFYNFGNEMHVLDQSKLSKLGTALRNPHLNCPDWDRLGDSDLDTVRGIRGTELLNSISNHNHDNAHPRTLSTLIGCCSDSANCPQYCSPITYRAYALYSQSFAHTYLSWAVYLPDRLWESLLKLLYEFKKHDYANCTSLHLCSTALPLLYLHGFTPPEGTQKSSLTCSEIIAKLQEIVAGKPIADLMTAMDDFLYRIREPFIFTLVALSSLAFLIFANTMLYRIDILHIRSHLIRTKASHRIDVKALLSDSKKMMSLYNVDYFDDDPVGGIGI